MRRKEVCDVPMAGSAQEYSSATPTCPKAQTLGLGCGAPPGGARLHDAQESRILSVMAKEPERFDPKERAREKQRSREEDARALASGEKSPEQLQRENGHFSFPNARVTLRGTKPLE